MSLTTCQVGVAFIFELLVQSIGMPKLASKWPAKLLNERFHPALVAVEEFNSTAGAGCSHRHGGHVS